MDLANHQRESAGEEGVFRTNTADNTYFRIAIEQPWRAA